METAKIFDTPEGFKVPEIDFGNYNRQEHQKKEEKFLKDLRGWLKKNGYKGKNSGELIMFSVADGNAIYMVISMEPLELIHIPFGDAYEFQYVNRLTAGDIQEKIDQAKALKKIFS